MRDNTIAMKLFLIQVADYLYGKMFLKDLSLSITSAILGMICHFLAKYVWQEIHWTILGGIFMFYSGLVMGHWFFRFMSAQKGLVFYR